MAVLEVLSGSPVPLGLAELSQQLGRGRQELFRVCACLERLGYIVRDPLAPKWSLSFKLFGLTHSHSPIEKLLAAAQEPMRHFAERTGEGCHLSVRDRDSLLVIAQHESPEKVRLSVAVGSRFELLGTASGRLLLALQVPTGDWTRRLGALAKSLGLAHAARLRVQRRMGVIVRERVSRAKDESRRGVLDTVVPIEGPAGLLAALACTRLLVPQQDDEATITVELTRTAGQIAAKLGKGPV